MTYLFHLAIIGANIIWGLYATVCKGFLNSGLMGSWALCGIKMMGGAALFWLLAMALPRSIAPNETVARKDLVRLFFASMLINAGSQSCIIIGLDYTSPIDGTVICSMAPIFTLALAAILFRQKISTIKGIGVITGFMGAILFVLPGLFGGSATNAVAANGSNPLLGNALMVASQVFGALYLLLFTDVLGRYSAVTLIKWLFLFSAIVLAPVTATDIIATNWPAMDTASWLQLGYIIVFATGLAYFLLVIGQKRVSPTAIAMYNYVQPITAMVSSVAVGVATLTTQNIIATALCLLGVYIVSRK